MNSLEFIDKLISDIDTAIRLRKIDMKVYEALEDTEEIESNQYALKQLGDYMQHFKQIKNEIEAWEVINNRFEYFEMEEGDVFVNKQEVFAQTSPFDTNDLKIIKKVVVMKND